eukprot:g29302.t1
MRVLGSDVARLYHRWCALVTYFFCQVRNLNYDTRLLFIDRDDSELALRTQPVFYQDLITVWNMVDSRCTYPPAGVAAIVRELLFGNPHLCSRRFDWLSEGRAVAEVV